MVRAFGSYPKGRGFDSLRRYLIDSTHGGRGEGVNAPDCGSGIRGFESHRSPHSRNSKSPARFLHGSGWAFCMRIFRTSFSLATCCGAAWQWSEHRHTRDRPPRLHAAKHAGGAKKAYKRAHEKGSRRGDTVPYAAKKLPAGACFCLLTEKDAAEKSESGCQTGLSRTPRAFPMAFFPDRAGRICTTCR